MGADFAVDRNVFLALVAANILSDRQLLDKEPYQVVAATAKAGHKEQL